MFINKKYRIGMDLANGQRVLDLGYDFAERCWFARTLVGRDEKTGRCVFSKCYLE